MSKFNIIHSYRQRTFLKKKIAVCTYWQENPQNINVTEDDGSIVHTTNTWTGCTSPSSLVYSRRRSCQLFTYHRKPLVAWFATQNSN